MALIWDKQLFDEMYEINGEPWGHPGTRPGIKLHYHKFVMKNAIKNKAIEMLSLPGMASINTIAVVGGAFGWTVEAIEESGRTAIVVDTSDYIVNNFGGTEENELREHIQAAGLDPDIDTIQGPSGPINPLVLYGAFTSRSSGNLEPQDLTTNGSRNAVRQALGNQLDAILTEDVLPGLDDLEAVEFISNVDATRQNPADTVIHMVTPIIKGGVATDPRLNQKTILEWKNLADINGFTDHRWINSITLEFI